MNGSIQRRDFTGYHFEVKEEQPMEEYGKFSGYSMAAMAGALLLCVGIVLYALLTA